MPFLKGIFKLLIQDSVINCSNVFPSPQTSFEVNHVFVGGVFENNNDDDDTNDDEDLSEQGCQYETKDLKKSCSHAPVRMHYYWFHFDFFFVIFFQPKKDDFLFKKCLYKGAKHMTF